MFDIPQNLQTKGVPWIAVDGPRGVAYMAEWDPTPELHVFALATMAYQRAIPLSTPTGRVQGGKVYKGQLYLTTDDATKHVYKVHLASGTIFPVLALNDSRRRAGGPRALPTTGRLAPAHARRHVGAHRRGAASSHDRP